MLAQTGNTSDYWNMVRYVTEHGIIGTEHAGTDWEHYWLLEHGQVCYSLQNMELVTDHGGTNRQHQWLLEHGHWSGMLQNMKL